MNSSSMPNIQSSKGVYTIYCDQLIQSLLYDTTKLWWLQTSDCPQYDIKSTGLGFGLIKSLKKNQVRYAGIDRVLKKLYLKEFQVQKVQFLAIQIQRW